MATVAKNFSAVVLNVSKTLKTSSGSVVNIGICLITAGSEQLFSFTVFTCPCIKDDLMSENATTMGVRTGLVYGTVFIAVPAIILFVLGCAMNIKTWKMMTGCRTRNYEAARGCKAGCATLMEVMLQAMVAPSAWVSIAFLDGKYFACAASIKPYDMECEKVYRASPSKVQYTVEYESKKQLSQIIGWVFIAVILFFGTLVYLIYRWCSKLTYHQRHYMKWYREIEHELFEEVAKEQLKEQAKENIENFLEEKRKKFDWDKIATVFTFKYDKNKYALYSRLDEWNEEYYESDSSSEKELTKKDVEVDTKLSTCNDNSITRPRSEDKGFVSSDAVQMKPISTSAPPPATTDIASQISPKSKAGPHRSNSETSMTKFATCRAKTRTPRKLVKQDKNLPEDNRRPFSTQTAGSNFERSSVNDRLLDSTNC
ncbi:calcium homeostasis modulator protein 6-like isoform X2 [Clavelina lepadiformis]|uniref:calcium homeostasis modulator protein 6-like isoform X2 n=1 Tax=Clavelina lepadiformis TaxID=159417 RepID=UPI0040427BFB